MLQQQLNNNKNKKKEKAAKVIDKYMKIFLFIIINRKLKRICGCSYSSQHTHNKCIEYSVAVH